MIAVLPNAKQNGVSPMGVRAVVLYAHKVLGSLFAHIPFAPSSRVLISLSKDQFVTLTFPLACGQAKSSGSLFPIIGKSL